MFVQTFRLFASSSPRFASTYAMFVQTSRHFSPCFPHFTSTYAMFVQTLGISPPPLPKNFNFFSGKKQNWFASDKKNKKKFRKKPRIGFLPENFFTKKIFVYLASIYVMFVQTFRQFASSSPRFASTYTMFVQTFRQFASSSPRFASTYAMFVQTSRHFSPCFLHFTYSHTMFIKTSSLPLSKNFNFFSEKNKIGLPQIKKIKKNLEKNQESVSSQKIFSQKNFSLPRIISCLSKTLCVSPLPLHICNVLSNLSAALSTTNLLSAGLLFLISYFFLRNV